MKLSIINDFMKILLVFILILNSINTFSQWETVYFPSTSPKLPNLNSVDFLNSNNGMAAGFTIENCSIIKPIIIRTFNSGTNWDTTYYSTDSIELKKITILDSLTVFAVGSSFPAYEKGVIVRTNNFGLTWDTIIFPHRLNFIEFPSHNIGYAVGSNGAVYKTINCGNSWLELNIGNTEYLYNTRFINDSIGFILGDNKIYKTTNGGNNWTATNLGLNSGFPYLSVSNDSTLYCFSNVYDTINLFKTTDCGNTWNLHSSHYFFDHAYSMFFNDANTGFITGFFAIEKTIDGGLTWIKQSASPPSSGYFYDSVTDLCFINKDTGFAVGSSQFYRTYNGGDSLFIPENDNNLTPIFAYPNPFSDYTNIKFDNSMHDNCTMLLYNSKGQIVYQAINNKEENFRIYKKELNKGLYFFQIKNDYSLIGNGKLIIK